VALIRGQAGRALVYPFAPFFLGQRVHIQHHFPLRLFGPVAFQCGAAQQPLGIGLVLPEIVEPVGAKADKRNAVIAVEDRQCFGLQFLEARIAGESFQRAGVFVLDPFQRLGIARFLEPDIGILLGAGYARLVDVIVG